MEAIRESFIFLPSYRKFRSAIFLSIRQTFAPVSNSSSVIMRPRMVTLLFLKLVRRSGSVIGRTPWV